MKAILDEVQDEIIKFVDVDSEYGKGCLDTLSSIREKYNLISEELEELRCK